VYEEAQTVGRQRRYLSMITVQCAAKALARCRVKCYTSFTNSKSMSKEPALPIGIILSLLGVIIWMANANASGPEAYEEMYWAFGGCLTGLTGIIIIIVSLLWQPKKIDLEPNSTVKIISIPEPVLVNDDA
jgi:hypothetical protein